MRPLPLPAAPRPVVAAVAVALIALPASLTACSGGADDDAAGAAASSSASPSSEASATSEASSSAPAPPPSTPAPGTSVSGVAEGFPTDLIPVLEGATVRSTSAIPDGDSVDVSLAASTSAPPPDVLAFYRDRLVAAGFTESAAAQPEGATGANFVRGGGRELVSVAIVTVEGQQEFTVGGTIAR